MYLLYITFEGSEGQGIASAYTHGNCYILHRYHIYIQIRFAIGIFNKELCDRDRHYFIMIHMYNKSSVYAWFNNFRIEIPFVNFL